MNHDQIDAAVSTRARVRISERNGYHKGLEGIVMGYRAAYDSIKVGFADEAGKYTGVFTTMNVKHVDLIGVADPEPKPSGVARIFAELDALNRKVAETVTTPEDVVDVDGRVWTWKVGNVYRSGGTAVPRDLIQEARSIGRSYASDLGAVLRP